MLEILRCQQIILIHADFNSEWSVLLNNEKSHLVKICPKIVGWQ